MNASITAPNEFGSLHAVILSIGFLIAVTLAVATQTHLLCGIICLHGGMEEIPAICHSAASP